MEILRKTLLKNRYTVLVTTLVVYMLALVIEGAITGREARVIDLDNPFFDLNIRDYEDFLESRGGGRND